MGELSTYELTNFIPFSESVYLRLFETFIEQLGLLVWGWVVGSVLLAVALWYGRHRVAGAVVAVAFATSGYLFLQSEYASLNWAATYAAVGFGAEAVLLAIATWRGHLESKLRKPVVAAAAVVLMGLPHAVRAVAAGELPVIEVFGLTPDVTAGVAVVIIASSRAPWRWLYLVVPILWLLFSALTWVALDAYMGLVVPGASGLALAVLTVANVASDGDEA